MKKESIKLSGFTFIKNGLSLGYPFLESIRGIEPICDEIVINVGFEDRECTKDDGTFEFLTKNLIGEKYIFCKSYWDPNIMSEGLILSEQTNIALSKIRGEYGLYIQGDECIHEQDFEKIRKSIKRLDRHKSADAVLFNYHHFYGSTDIVRNTKKAYRNEVRLIRNGRGIKSWLDAQGFRNENDTKVKCIKSDAYIYHYGWARAQQLMDAKSKAFTKLYHGKDHKEEDFSYRKVWGLQKFVGSHPIVMKNWIAENKNDLDIMSLPMDIGFKETRVILSDFFEYLTGVRLGEYRNYKLVK